MPDFGFFDPNEYAADSEHYLKEREAQNSGTKDESGTGKVEENAADADVVREGVKEVVRKEKPSNEKGRKKKEVVDIDIDEEEERRVYVRLPERCYLQLELLSMIRGKSVNCCIRDLIFDFIKENKTILMNPALNIFYKKK